MAAPSTPRFPDRAEAVTPSDVTEFVPSTIYVGVTGDVTVQPAGGGSSVTFTAVPAGSVVPVRVTQVLSTGTTATNLVRVS